MLSTAELFHPGTGTWTATGGTFYERSGHTATLLPNGKVLVEGGQNTNTEVYDPNRGEWYLTGRLNFARNGAAATLLSDGKVLVVGGNDPNNANPTVPHSAEIYDPVTQVWAPTVSLIYGHRAPTATLLMNGQVLVVGQSSSTVGRAVDTVCELYDPATEVWTLTDSLAYFRVGHTATRLDDGTVLVTGGLYQGLDFKNVSLNIAEIYDPTSGRWSVVGNLNVARHKHTATLLPNGKILVVGGLHVNQFGLFVLKSAELYDPATQAWMLADDLSVARYVHTETLLRVRQLERPGQFMVLVAGGDDLLSNSLADVELFSGGPPTRV
jgi:hypothetical protein